MRHVSWLVVAGPLFAGCLFRNTSPPPRFFAPGSAAVDRGADDDPSFGTGVPIRLRPVHGTAFLREHIVWRVSAVEYGQYGDRLWSELPASYVQRALRGTLSRTPGLRLTSSTRAAELRVDVVAFEEVLAPGHAATVALAASLRDEGGEARLDRTFTVSEPIVGDDPAAMARAMGRALDNAVAAVAAAVAETVGAGDGLKSHPPS